MTREEILEKSRKENKNRDVYEREVLQRGANVGAIAAAVLALVFCIVQIALDYGMDYGLYAVLFAFPAGQFAVKAIRLKRKHEIAVAVFYGLFTLLLAAAHLWQLASRAGL